MSSYPRVHCFLDCFFAVCIFFGTNFLLWTHKLLICCRFTLLFVRFLLLIEFAWPSFNHTPQQALNMATLNFTAPIWTLHSKHLRQWHRNYLWMRLKEQWHTKTASHFKDKQTKLRKHKFLSVFYHAVFWRHAVVLLFCSLKFWNWKKLDHMWNLFHFHPLSSPASKLCWSRWTDSIHLQLTC